MIDYHHMPVTQNCLVPTHTDKGHSHFDGNYPHHIVVQINKKGTSKPRQAKAVSPHTTPTFEIHFDANQKRAIELLQLFFSRQIIVNFPIPYLILSRIILIWKHTHICNELIVFHRFICVLVLKQLLVAHYRSLILSTNTSMYK